MPATAKVGAALYVIFRRGLAGRVHARARVCDLRVVRGWVGGWGGVLSEHTYSSST